ncbi:MAG: ATP-binding protein [Gemmatimonadaceae bacterium]
MQFWPVKVCNSKPVLTATSLDALRDREDVLSQAERDEARARAAEAEAARRLGAEMTPDRLAALDVGAFAGLAAFARRADRFRGEVEACEAEVRQAAALPEPGPVAPERLQAGIRVLQQWLREPEAGNGAASTWAVWTAAFVGVTGWILLALKSGPFAAVGALAVLVLTLLGLRASRPGASLRETRRADYERLGLGKPATWAEAEVAVRLDDLLAQLAAAEIGKQRTQWLEHARGRLARLDQERAELEAERQALVDRLGVAPDTDSVRLVVIAEQAGRLLEARQMVAGAVAAREEAERQLDLAAREVDTAFDNAGFAPPTGYAAAQAELNTILELSRRYETAVKEATAARLARETAQNRLVVVHGELKELYARCDCAFGDARMVKSHCGQHADFQSAERQLDLLRHELERVTVALRAIEAEHQYVASLGSPATAELEAERALAMDKVAERDLLRDERTTLQTRIATAKDASDVGNALARLAAAEGALRAARAKDRRAMIGHALLQCVRQASHNQHRPPVFRSASDRFARITCGRYTLDLPDESTGGIASFRALDAHTGRGYALNELSSATRIQLLLAVRIAFVESQEVGLKLPLFLDETLATSDDHRAAAIIEAIVAIAEEGRQVFYFTAQHDEVAKWNAALTGRAVDYKEHDLRKLRPVFTRDLEPSPFAGLMAQMEQPLPEVGSHTYETYGAVLGVPPIMPGRTPLSATHLWYLTDDPGKLRQVLGTGLTTWGELQNLIAANAVKLLADHPQVISRGAALAKALEVMHAQAAIGLGKPVDREVLEASGAVSAKMMPHVLKLAGECSGHASKLLEALTAGRVSGFQAKKIAELREYLEEQEYVDPRVPPSAAEIRILMLAAVQHEVGAGILVVGDIDTLIRRVVRGPTAPEPGLSMEVLQPTGDAPEVS